MPATTHLKSRLLYNARATLGEGPVWDPRRGVLFWVDIEGGRLHGHHLKSGENTAWEFDGMIGAVIPECSGRYIVAHEKGLKLFDPEGGKTEPLGLLANTEPRLRFNDGKCDPSGNLWIGTMDKELAPGAGKLYRVSKSRGTSAILDGTTVSNGMAWSADHRIYYYIDSATFEVWRFDYDPQSAEISNKTVAFGIPEKMGAPDGMCIDLDGKLWIAHWGGHCVRRWDPVTGEVLQTIEVAAPHVTSCCFGGDAMDALYITTARSGLSPWELEKFPLSGGLFCCPVKTRGATASCFKLNL